MSEIKNAASYLAGMTYLKDALVGLGMTDEDFCNPGNILTSIEKAISDFAKNVLRAIGTLSFKIGGNFLATAATILAEILQSSVLNVLNTAVMNSIASVIRTLVSIFASILSVLAGADLVVQYYQIRYLKSKLEQREKLMSILSYDMDIIIQFVRSLSSLGSNDDGAFAKNSLEKVIEKVKAAKFILVNEKIRITDSSEEKQIKLINRRRIANSQDKLLEAIELLTDGYFSKVSDALTVIENEFGLKTKHPRPSNGVDVSLQGLTFVTWYTYLGELWEELRAKFFSYENKEGTVEYAIERRNKQRLYFKLMSVLIPQFPKMLQILLLQQALGSSIEHILTKMPVFVAGAVNILSKNLDKLLKGDNPSSKLSFTNITDQSNLFNINLGELSGGLVTEISPDYDFFENPETKNLTVKALTTAIKYTEAAVLMFPEMWRDLVFMGSFQISILNDVISSLNLREKEMRDTLIEDSSSAAISLKKLAWSTQLLVDHNKLSVLSEKSSVEIGGVSFSGSDMQELVLKAGKKLEELKYFIINKSFNFKTQQPNDEPIEMADKIAQKYLFPLVGNIFVLLNGRASSKIVAALQSMKLLFEKQLNFDSVELQLCNEYINILESNPAFMKLKAYIDSLINDFSKTAAGQFAEAMLNGDLGVITDALQGVEDTYDLVDSLLCTGEVTPSKPYGFLDMFISSVYTDPLSISDAAKRAKSLTKEVTEAMNSLTEQKAILSDTLSNIETQLQKITESTADTAAEVPTFESQAPNGIDYDINYLNEKLQ